MILLSILLYILLMDEELNFYEGIALLAILFIYLYILIKKARSTKETDLETNDIMEKLSHVSGVKTFIWFLIGGIAFKHSKQTLPLTYSSFDNGLNSFQVFANSTPSLFKA